MTGIKAKIVTSLLTRSVVTYEFGINLTTKTKKLGKKDGGWGVIKKVANRVEKVPCCEERSDELRIRY